LPGERDNARNNARCTQARETKHGLDGQHLDVSSILIPDTATSGSLSTPSGLGHSPNPNPSHLGFLAHNPKQLLLTDFFEKNMRAELITRFDDRYTVVTFFKSRVWSKGPEGSTLTLKVGPT